MTEPVDILDIASSRLFAAQERYRATWMMNYTEYSAQAAEQARAAMHLATGDVAAVRNMIADLAEVMEV